MSWGTCDPQVVDAVFTGPGVYDLVLSAAGFTPGPTADDHTGTDLELVVQPIGAGGLPDAWRFDDLGCQQSGRVAVSGAALNAECPALAGPNPIAITSVSPFEDAAGVVRIRVACAHDTRSPTPGTRYTLWMVSFDMTSADAGEGTPGATCGGADRHVRIGSAFAELSTLRGVAAAFQTAPGDQATVTWNESLVPTGATTWGRVKGLYR
jgi:hypothetical protein